MHANKLFITVDNLYRDLVEGYLRCFDQFLLHFYLNILFGSNFRLNTL